MSNILHKIQEELIPFDASLVAVSKTKPNKAIMDLYDQGQRIFGENKAQELQRKYEALPKDIEWHMIGHMQTNKVKYIAPFISLIHSVDSTKLLETINKEAAKNARKIAVLLQVKIANEDTKYGLDINEAKEIIDAYNRETLPNISVHGLMGMASFTDNMEQVEKEFNYLKKCYEELLPNVSKDAVNFTELSMGMSGDYPLALSCGSTMVRIGSKLFGARNY